MTRHSYDVLADNVEEHVELAPKALHVLWSWALYSSWILFPLWWSDQLRALVCFRDSILYLLLGWAVWWLLQPVPNSHWCGFLKYWFVNVACFGFLNGVLAFFLIPLDIQTIAVCVLFCVWVLYCFRFGRIVSLKEAGND